MTYFTRTEADNPDFKMLVALLDDYLAIKDGNQHSFYHQFNQIENLRHVIICYIDEIPTGCGAFKEFDSKTVEIKRMFVQPINRGQGIGLAILKELEKWASELNYATCILETGKKQTEAVSLYLKAGYSIIRNYGQYENIDNSVCMTKHIL